MPKINLRR